MAQHQKMQHRHKRNAQKTKELVCEWQRKRKFPVKSAAGRIYGDKFGYSKEAFESACLSYEVKISPFNYFEYLHAP